MMVGRFMALFQTSYGDYETVITMRDIEWVSEKVVKTAGIHFSSFDQGDSEKSKVKTSDEEAREAGAKPVRSNWRPDAAWRAEVLQPAKPIEQRGIKILE